MNLKFTAQGSIKQIGKTFSGQFTIIFFLLTLVSFSSSCSYLEDFSRRQAANLISENEKFKKSISYDTYTGGMVDIRAEAWQLSADETIDQAFPRAKENLKQKHPELFVAEHLGLLKLSFDKGELRSKQLGMPSELYIKNMGVWSFMPKAEITDAGRQLWKDLDKNVIDEALPLAVRGTPEITGMAEESETMRRAEFTYGWEPTPFGAALDPNNDAFKKLPKELQEVMKADKKVGLFGSSSSRLKDFGGQQRGAVRFIKYDDGWRIRELYVK